jgi:hypothetical protein
MFEMAALVETKHAAPLMTRQMRGERFAQVLPQPHVGRRLLLLVPHPGGQFLEPHVLALQAKRRAQPNAGIEQELEEGGELLVEAFRRMDNSESVLWCEPIGDDATLGALGTP